jgi:hypothetical protein
MGAQLMFFRFNGDQAMGCLPFLIWIFSLTDIQKLMIIQRSLFVVVQMIVGGGAKEKTDWRQVGI